MFLLVTRRKSSPFEQHADFFQLDLRVIERKFGAEFYLRQPAQPL
jgi:hypothetical protein